MQGMAAHTNTRYYGSRMTDETRESRSFTRDEMKRIRDMLSTDDMPQVCPRCGGQLLLKGPVAGGGSIGFVWRAACEKCDLTNFVAESVARAHDDLET